MLICRVCFLVFCLISSTPHCSLPSCSSSSCVLQRARLGLGVGVHPGLGVGAGLGLGVGVHPGLGVGVGLGLGLLLPLGR